MNSNMKRIIASFLLVILAFIVQTCIFPLLPFLAVYPNLMVILVFSFGFIRGSAWGMGYGLIVGLLMDLSSGGPLGFHTLIFIWMGYRKSAGSVWLWKTTNMRHRTSLQPL